ncbi:MAG: choice-of-anchor X domain-containing protein [Candidatus Manganitrophaceae bacterium]
MEKRWKLQRSLWILALFLAGCGGGGTESQPAAVSQEKNEVEAALSSGEDATLLSSDVAFEEDDQEGTEEGSGLSKPLFESHLEPLLPTWHRHLTHRERTVDIHIERGVADLTVTRLLDGFLHLDVDGNGDKGKKEFQVNARRFATFERKGPRSWKLIELSPIEYTMRDPNKQTVQIEWVKGTVGDLVRAEVTDPAGLFVFPDGLPTFHPAEEVLVEAKVSNKNDDGSERPTRVFLHHRFRKDSDHTRESMYDDGTHGDRTAGDGVFTLLKTVGEKIGFHQATVDALDGAVFDDETTQNYNGEAWKIPYRVTETPVIP